MKYTKPALTFPDQADLLLKRGLVAPSKQAIIEKLRAVSYYRLSAYWHPFRESAEIPLAAMGFPTNWKDSPLWQAPPAPRAPPATPPPSPTSGGTP